MRPDKEKTGLENFIALLIDSNPNLTLTPNQIHVENIRQDEPIEGRTTVNVVALPGEGYTGNVDVNYTRHGLDVYASGDLYVVVDGDENLTQVMNKVGDQLDLVSTELTATGYALPVLEGPQMTPIQVDTVLHSIVYDASAVNAYLTVVPIDENVRKTTTGVVRRTTDGIIRRINVVPTLEL